MNHVLEKIKNQPLLLKGSPHNQKKMQTTIQKGDQNTNKYQKEIRRQRWKIVIIPKNTRK
uniref:Uncharacterized protein n=1 Tax=Rhizophora mucronata TaxID=61149 RepID=A0A2P2LX84_RHIMU